MKTSAAASWLSAVYIIDHTAVETVLHYLEDYKRNGIKLELVGWADFVPLSDHHAAIRIRPAGHQQTGSTVAMQGQLYLSFENPKISLLPAAT